MDRDDEFDDLFSKLEGKIPHSDIYYMQLYIDLLAAIDTIIKAYEDRNSDKEVKKLKLNMIATLIQMLFFDEMSNAGSEPIDILDVVIATICALADLPSDYFDCNEKGDEQ